MTANELKTEFTSMVDDYYKKLADCKTPTEVFQLNWDAKDRGISLMFRAFNFQLEDKQD